MPILLYMYPVVSYCTGRLYEYSSLQWLLQCSGAAWKRAFWSQSFGSAPSPIFCVQKQLWLKKLFQFINSFKKNYSVYEVRHTLTILNLDFYSPLWVYYDGAEFFSEIQIPEPTKKGLLHDYSRYRCLCGLLIKVLLILNFSLVGGGGRGVGGGGERGEGSGSGKVRNPQGAYRAVFKYLSGANYFLPRIRYSIFLCNNYLWEMSRLLDLLLCYLYQQISKCVSTRQCRLTVYSIQNSVFRSGAFFLVGSGFQSPGADFCSGSSCNNTVLFCLLVIIPSSE